LADKRCDNGHFIDESWDLCPYCPQDASGEPEIPVVRPRPVTAEVPRVTPRTIAVRGVDPAVGAKRYVVGWLVGISGATRGESFTVRMGRNVLGRDRRSDIVVNDDQASSHHADLVFRPEERRFILMDHNSTNGTYVNDTEIEPRRDLADKDIIRIGSHRFLFMPLCHDGFHWDDEGLLK
jgi:hypothetical protein